MKVSKFFLWFIVLVLAFKTKETLANNGLRVSSYCLPLPTPSINITLIPNSNLGRYCQTDVNVLLKSSYKDGTWSSKVNCISGDTFFNPSMVTAKFRDQWFDLNYSYKDPISGADSVKSVKVFVQTKPSVQIINNDTSFCRSNIVKLSVISEVKNTGKIYWYQDFNDGRIKFDGQTVSSNNPCQLTLYPRNDSISHYKIIVLSEAEGVCPSDSDELKIDIYPIPKVALNIDKTEACILLQAHFETRIFNDIDSLSSKFTLDFGDGTRSTLKETQHFFTRAGSYYINLKVESESGCDTNLHKTINIHNAPKADFISTPSDYAQISYPVINFINKSKARQLDTLVSFHWDFGDYNNINDTSQLINPSYVYPTDTGTYRVRLTAITQYGCIDTFESNILVKPDEPLGFRIFPVPIKDGFSYEINKPGEFILEIFDTEGRIIYYTKSEGLNIQKANLEIASGLYLIRVKDLFGKEAIKRIIKL